MVNQSHPLGWVGVLDYLIPVVTWRKHEHSERIVIINKIMHQTAVRKFINPTLTSPCKQDLRIFLDGLPQPLSAIPVLPL